MKYLGNFIRPKDMTESDWVAYAQRPFWDSPWLGVFRDMTVSDLVFNYGPIPYEDGHMDPQEWMSLRNGESADLENNIAFAVYRKTDD